MVYKIAVVDDTKSDSDMLNQIITESLNNRGISDFEISVFYSSKELLENKNGIEFNIYFLDVVMPQMSGIEIGTLIREHSKTAIIIYITSTREYAFEAFSVRAFHYIEKPITYNLVDDVIGEAFKVMDKELEEQIIISTNEGIVGIRLSNIMYVENVSRRSVYYLYGDKTITSKYNRTTFEESVGKLAQCDNFLHVHKSFFVNMEYINRIQGENFILDDNRSIPISRNKYNDAKRKYLKYLADGGH